MKQNRHWLSELSSNMPICYCIICYLQSQGEVRVEYFYDLRRRSRRGAKLFGVGVDTESKNRTLSISGVYAKFLHSAQL